MQRHANALYLRWTGSVVLEREIADCERAKGFKNTKAWAVIADKDRRWYGVLSRRMRGLVRPRDHWSLVGFSTLSDLQIKECDVWPLPQSPEELCVAGNAFEMTLGRLQTISYGGDSPLGALNTQRPI